VTSRLEERQETFVVKLDERGLERAADELWKTGIHHGWWSKRWASWRDLDPIGKEEFLAIADRIVVAYLRRDANSAG
jgi:hypothetical protein